MISKVYVYKTEYISILMQTLEFANKSTSKNQKAEQISEVENTREVRGETLATTRVIYRIQNSDTYYVQSQSKRSDNIFYFVRFNPSVLEYCSCPDNSYRGNTCKHIFGVIAGIKKGTVIDVDKLPKELKRDNSMVSKSSFTEAEYSF